MLLLSPEQILKKLKAKGIEAICFYRSLEEYRMVGQFIALNPHPNMGRIFNSKEVDMIVDFLRKHKSDDQNALIVRLMTDRSMFDSKYFYF